MLWGFIKKKHDIVEIKIQNLTLGAMPLIIHKKRYWTEAIPTMWYPYKLKDLKGQMNEPKVDYVRVNPMDKFQVQQQTPP